MAFLDHNPSLQDYWRGIVLFGRNVASYKLALAKTLLDLADESTTAIPLEKLALPYANHLCKHLAQNPKQITSKSSRYLDRCAAFNRSEITQDALVEATVEMGFNNVIDAFHVVNAGPIPVRFFADERAGGRIVLTDDLLRLRAHTQYSNLPHEVEARWRLVESAWHLNLPASLLQLHYDNLDGSLFIEHRSRRVGLTSCRTALNGYQRGWCFYCGVEILVDGSANTEVDHFFPRTLLTRHPGINWDGVWNLVLACEACNSGEGGKFARIPELRFLERLEARNNYFIESHHPLRETLINQTGTTTAQRHDFLQARDTESISCVIHRWAPRGLAPPL
jgi:hypothetical protein